MSTDSRNSLDLDEGEVTSDAYQPNGDNMPRLRGGEELPHHGGDSHHNRWWVDTSATRAGARAPGGRLTPITIEDDSESDVYEVPPPATRLSDEHQHAYRRDSAAVSAGRPVENQFDFNNSSQPLPWNNSRHGSGLQFRSFANGADAELLVYLESRMISTGFLAEIDQFLYGHPEIASCTEGRSTLHQLNTLSPLDAYKYFLRGYTRPARYIDGVIKTEPFQLPMSFPYQPLSTKHDPELVDFFDGFEYRHDIIQRIDQEVFYGIEELSFCRPVPLAMRKLVCYAIWGNPVDAYKWYEYSYQQDYMAHTYLPEHVVLGHVSRPADYAEPEPSVMRSWRSHRVVRFRMARAKDQGVDVLDVLMSEFRLALVRKGHRRIDVDNLYSKAKARLENERQRPTGVDIVDMIMDGALTHQATHRRPPSRPRQSAPYEFQFSRSSLTVHVGANSRVTVRNVPMFLHVPAQALRQAKSDLQRLYTQEATAYAAAQFAVSNIQAIRASRGRAERKYVNCLIRYLRGTQRISSLQANQLQHNFTREKSAVLGVQNRDYLLGMFPRELD